MNPTIRAALRTLAVSLVIILSLDSSVSQSRRDSDWIYQAEVYGGAGWGGLYHGPYRREADGMSLVAGVGVRPFSGSWAGLGFEGRVDYLQSGSNLWEDVRMLSGNVTYHFGRSRVQPYVYGGLCLLRSKRNIVITYGSGMEDFYEEEYQDSVKKTGLNFGAGLRIGISKRFSVRPELRLTDTTAGRGYNLSAPQFLTSVGLSW